MMIITSSMEKFLLILFIINFNWDISLVSSQITNSSFNYSYAFANSYQWKTSTSHNYTIITNPNQNQHQNQNPIPIPVPGSVPLQAPIPNSHLQNIPILNSVTVQNGAQKQIPIQNQKPLHTQLQNRSQLTTRPLVAPQAPKRSPINGQKKQINSPLYSQLPNGNLPSTILISQSCPDGARCPQIAPTNPNNNNLINNNQRATPPPLIHKYTPSNTQQVQTYNNNNNNRPINDGNYVTRETSNYANVNNMPEHPDTAIFKRVIEGYQADQLDLLQSLIAQQIQAMKIMNNEQKLSG